MALYYLPSSLGHGLTSYMVCYILLDLVYIKYPHIIFVGALHILWYSILVVYFIYKPIM
jgi:hypothetical protein